MPWHYTLDCPPCGETYWADTPGPHTCELCGGPLTVRQPGAEPNFAAEGDPVTPEQKSMVRALADMDKQTKAGRFIAALAKADKGYALSTPQDEWLRDLYAQRQAELRKLAAWNAGKAG